MTRTAGEAARECSTTEASSVRTSTVQSSSQPGPSSSSHSWSIWGICLPSTGSSRRICVPCSPWSLWGICLPILGISRRICVPCSPWSLWGICLPSLGISRRICVPCSPWSIWRIRLPSSGCSGIYIPSSLRPGCSSQETERLLASEVRSVESRLTAPTRDQEPQY